MAGASGTQDPVVVLCAGPGVGKTTWCIGLAATARARGLGVAGLVTPSERGAGARRWAEDLRSGQRRLLAREDADASSHPDTPRWLLFDDVLQWGDARLREARETDVLVIDELGPVELVRGRGWLAGATEALRGTSRLAVVAVRPLLLSSVLEFLSGHACEIVRPDGRGRFLSPEELLARRFGPAPGSVPG